MPATLALPTSSESQNLAPAAKLERAFNEAQQDTSIEVEVEWFGETKHQLESENALTWKNQALLWEMLYLFVEGKHLLKRGRAGGWRAVGLPNNTSEPVYGYNLAGFYSETIDSKWTQSQTGIRWRGASDDDALLGAANAANKIHEFLYSKLYTETFKRMEAKHAQCGKYARYYYYTNDLKITGRKEKIEPQELSFGGGSWFCPDCGEGGGGDALQAGQGVVSTPQLAGGQPGYDSNQGYNQVPANQGQLSGLDPNELAEYQAGIEQPHPPGLEAYEQEQFSTGVAASVAQNGAAQGAVGSAGLSQFNSTDLNAVTGSSCPSCGSPNIEQEQVEPITVQAVTGYEDVTMGDIACETVSAFELKHDLSFNPHESPYLIRRRRIRVAVLQSKFPFLAVKSTNSDNAQMQAADNLKYSVFGTSNYTGLGLRRGDVEREPTTDFIQIWLDPSLYARNVLKSDYRTVGGQNIPAGTKLIEMFPDGMYQCWIEGVEGCIELRNEHHRDYWVGQVYRPRVMSALGSGIEDIIESNRQLDLMMSLMYTQLRTSAMPATLFDERLLPNGVSSYLGSLQNIPVALNALDDTRSLKDSVHQLMPQPPTPQHFGFTDKLNEFMRLFARTTDFSEEIGVDQTTLGGAEIAKSLAQSLFGPQLALKAEMDRRGAEIELALWRKNVPYERFVALAGKRGKQEGIWLSGADVEIEMQAEIIPESYLPKTNLDRQRRWQSLLMDLGGLPGLKMAQAEMPQMLEQLTDLYDVDLGAEDYTAVSQRCQERVQQMRQALPMVAIWLQGMPPTQMEVDPLSGMAVETPVDPLAEAGQFLVSTLKPPIEMEELGHMAAINWARSWLTEDAGWEAEPELRAGVKAMLQAHLQGLMAEAQLTSAVTAMGMPPVMPEQNADGGGPPNEQGKSKNKAAQGERAGGRPKAQTQRQGAVTA